MTRARDAYLVVNIGNTHTTAAICRSRRIIARERLPTPAAGDVAAKVVESLSRRVLPKGAAVASVVPAATPIWVDAIRRHLGRDPIEVRGDRPLGLRVSVRHPERVGADRLADMVAAEALYGAPVIVIDSGTATTVNVVLPRRGFIGGAIAPGPALFGDYLVSRTALLPRVDMWTGRVPDCGCDTESALRLGAQVGYVGMVRSILEHLRHGLALGDAPIVVTGGAGRWLSRRLGPETIWNGDLPLVGLGILAERWATGLSGNGGTTGRISSRPTAERRSVPGGRRSARSGTA